MSRATFEALAKLPQGVFQLDRGALVAALEWNDPNGDYREPAGKPGYVPTAALRTLLLCQVIDGMPSFDYDPQTAFYINQRG